MGSGGVATGLRFDAFTTRKWLALLERCERVRPDSPCPSIS
ncbi:hypothetical protein [Mycobacterium lacus]|nr:hypothetical protein [Mycobacterium lacus]